MTTAQKGNPPVLSHGAGPKEGKLETDIIVANDGTDRQVFNLLQAKAAQVGQSLTKVVDGYILSRWSMTRHCTDLGEVKAVLLRMGAAK